jgi:hypothetical protein
VEHLVLGAYDCGVSRNKPEEVAAWFKQVLVDEGYANSKLKRSAMEKESTE